MTDFSVWEYHASVTITGSTDGALTDYPVSITVAYQSFMNTDFSDIRFALADDTELNYSLEDYTASSSADFLVQVPSLPESPDTVTIIIYAGNSSATTTSNSDLVYLINDLKSGESTDNWVNVGGASHSISNGQMTCQGSNDGLILHPTVISGDFSFQFNVVSYTDTTNGYWGTCAICCDGTLSNYYLLDLATNGYGGIDVIINGTDTALSGSFGTSYASPGLVKVVRVGSSIKLYANGTLIKTITDSQLTSGKIGFRQVVNRNKVVTNVKVLQTTANPPTSGTLGEWTLNGLVISTPPVQSTLTIITPQIAIGGAVTITVPSIEGILTVNPPEVRAILTSPSITAVSSVIPPVIAFLMEVKAGVTYNPDAIEDLKEDGVPCNISFNVTIGDQQYE